jgi:hypothetical protein
LTEPDELAAFWRGEDLAIEAVYRANVGALLAAARLIIGPAEADSVVQEVFVELIRNEALRRRFMGGSISGGARAGSTCGRSPTTASTPSRPGAT